jgi:hypothetical protein
MVVVNAPANIGQVAWSRSAGDNTPLQQRWDRLADQLRKRNLAPITPISEHSCYQMQAELDRRTQQIADDPIRSAASQQIWDLQNRYRAAATELVKLQQRTPMALKDPVHALLSDIPPNWNTQFAPEIRRRTDCESSTAEVRAEASWMVPTVLEIEDLVHRLGIALSIDSRAPTTLRDMILALFARLVDLEREALRTSERHAENLSVLDERIDLLEAKVDRVTKALKRRKPNAKKLHAPA